MAEQYLYDSNEYDKPSNNVNLVSDPLEEARAQNLHERFVFVDGRRFIADPPNVVLPHDNLEYIRNHRQHHIYKYIWKGLLSAPVKEIITVGDIKCLDVACGSGIWAIDMAKESPRSTFVGIDIGHDFPDDQVKPSNVGLLSGCNLINGIPFPDDTFDYVHQRQLLIEFPVSTWISAVIPEMIRITKPLGWIEVDDIEFEPKNMGPTMREFNKAFLDLSKKLGFVNCTALDVVRQFAGAGLKNIEFSEKQIPIGSCGGKLDEMIWNDMSDIIISLKTVLQTQMGITEEEYYQKIQQAGKETTEYKTYVISYRVWGQRP